MAVSIGRLALVEPGSGRSAREPRNAHDGGIRGNDRNDRSVEVEEPRSGQQTASERTSLLSRWDWNAIATIFRVIREMSDNHNVIRRMSG